MSPCCQPRCTGPAVWAAARPLRPTVCGLKGRPSLTRSTSARVPGSGVPGSDEKPPACWASARSASPSVAPNSSIIPLAKAATSRSAVARRGGSLVSALLPKAATTSSRSSPMARLSAAAGGRSSAGRVVTPGRGIGTPRTLPCSTVV